MRHVRLLILIALFVLLPARLLLVGVDVWLGVVEERRQEEDFERMSRHLRELREDVVAERDRLRVAREARDRFWMRPALDDALVAAAKAEFASRYAGLLDLHVFALPLGTTGEVVLLDGGATKHRFAWQTLANDLASNYMGGHSTVPETRLKLMRQTLLGGRLSEKQIELRRDAIVDVICDKRPAGLYWDILRGTREGQFLVTGLLVALVDTTASRNTWFTFERLLARERGRAAAEGISIEPLRVTGRRAAERLVADDPALLERLARFPANELRSAGGSVLRVAVPVRRADRLALVASKSRADSFPERDSYEWAARAFTAGAVLLFALLLVLRHTGRIPLFLPVRVQLGALFVLAALVPYGILVYAGMDQILGSRRELIREAGSRILQRIEAFESEQEARIFDLYDLALSIHEREAVPCFNAWLAARGRLLPPGTTGEVYTYAEPAFAPLRARVDSYFKDDLKFGVFVFDTAGVTVYRHEGRYGNNQVEDELLSSIGLSLIEFVNTGIASPLLGRPGGSSVLSRMISLADGKGELGGNLLAQSRGCLYRIDAMGFKYDLFLEPILDSGRRAVGVTVIAFKIDRTIANEQRREVNLIWGNPREEIKLALRHRTDRYQPLPPIDRMGDELYDFLGRIGEDKAPRNGRLVVGGEPVYAYGRLMSHDNPFAIAGLVSSASVDRTFHERIVLFAAVIFAGFIFSVALGLWIAGRIVRSLRTLSDGVQRVEAGGAGARIALESPDEFGALAGSFNTMSGNLALAMHRLERRILEVTTLYSVNQSISFTRSWNETLRVILDKAVEALDAEKGSLMLWNEAEARLETAVIAGFDGPIERRIGLRAGEGLAGRVFETGASEVIADAASDARFFRSDRTAESDATTRNLLCVPLKLKDRVLGVFNLTNKRGDRAFEAEDLSLVEALATQAAVTIENARLYDLSITDGMTGLYINRYFQVRMDEELKRAGRYGTSVALLFTDVDHFKNFNDTWGHQVGDRVLIQVARAMRRAIRDVDIPCRYGGEEFAVIAPNTDPEGVAIVAERMRRMIEEEPLEGPNGEKLTITISIGVATFPCDAADKETMVAAADTALYHAKRTGRNRWVRFADLPPEARGRADA